MQTRSMTRKLAAFPQPSQLLTNAQNFHLNPSSGPSSTAADPSQPSTSISPNPHLHAQYGTLAILPPELRDMIYNLVLEDTSTTIISYLPSSKPTDAESTDADSIKAKSTNEINGDKNPRLTHARICQLRAFPGLQGEIDTCLSKSVFVFTTPKTMIDFLAMCPSASSNTGYVRSIRLDLSHGSVGYEQWRAAFGLLPPSIRTIMMDFEGLAEGWNGGWNLGEAWIRWWETSMPKLSTVACNRSRSLVRFEFRGRGMGKGKTALERATVNCVGTGMVFRLRGCTDLVTNGTK